MNRGYVYKRPVKRSHYSNLRRQMLITVIILSAFAVVGYFIYSGLNQSAAKTVTSNVQNTEISGNKKTFINDYFQFEDTGDWIIEKGNTTANRIVYHKFRKNVLQQEMIVYINQVPIPLFLATQRVLPVRIVNNSFQVTRVSGPCGAQYAKGELHKVKELSINGATMLCDPDAQQYFVVFSEVNGNYQLNLKRSNGTPIQFVITYKDTEVNPAPNSLLNIAKSFKMR